MLGIKPSVESALKQSIYMEDCLKSCYLVYSITSVCQIIYTEVFSEQNITHKATEEESLEIETEFKVMI